MKIKKTLILPVLILANSFAYGSAFRSIRDWEQRPASQSIKPTTSVTTPSQPKTDSSPSTIVKTQTTDLSSGLLLVRPQSQAQVQQDVSSLIPPGSIPWSRTATTATTKPPVIQSVPAGFKEVIIPGSEKWRDEILTMISGGKHKNVTKGHTPIKLK